MTRTDPKIEAQSEFRNDPIGAMRKAAEQFEQNPVIYTHPISRRAKAIARIGLRAAYFLPAREREVRQRGIQAMEAVRAAFGERLHWIALEGGKTKAYRTVPLAIEALLDRYKDAMGVYVGSSNPEDAHGLQDFQALLFCGRYYGPNVPVMDSFEFQVPLSWSIETAEQGGFAGLALRVADILKPDWGTAGFALTVHNEHMNAEPRTTLHTLLQKYPGLDCGKGVEDSIQYKNGMGAVNWLTWVSNKLLQDIDGPEGAKIRLAEQQAGKQVIVAERDWGLLFQAGPLPGLGDNGDPGTLPAYQAVARALKPLRAPKSRGFAISREALYAEDEEIGNKERRAWIARFD